MSDIDSGGGEEELGGSSGGTMTLRPSRMAASPIQTDRIITFLRQVLGPKQKPKVKTVALCHLALEGPGTLLTIPVPDDVKKTEVERLVHDMAKRCEDNASADASTHDRPQRYCVAAYGPGDMMVGRWTFLVAPPMSNMIGNETEPPTEQGALSQSMRFSEVSMRLMVMTNQSQLDRFSEENDRLRNENKELRLQALEQLKQTQTLLDRKLERDMIIEDKAAERARAERTWKQFEKLIPALISKYGIGPADAVGAAESTPTAIAQVMKLLRPDQQKKLMEDVLDDDQANLIYMALGGKPEQNGVAS
jgi:hypothetical protein